MAILLGCEDGLYEYGSSLRPLSCPLTQITALTCGSSVAAIADRERLLWNGRGLFAVDPGVESVLWWRGNLLTLSSETDSLTLLDGQTGLPVMLAPAGIYPQHMCFVQQDTVAVCGGADGCIRIMALPSLSIIAQYHVPGIAARVCPYPGALYALCTVENGDLRCLICRISPRSSRCEPFLTLPGLPGAITDDHCGGFWAAAGERLYHLLPNCKTFKDTYDGFGLISSLAQTPQGLLICDPVIDQCCLLRHGKLTVIRSGGVHCAAVW